MRCATTGPAGGPGAAGSPSELREAVEPAYILFAGLAQLPRFVVATLALKMRQEVNHSRRPREVRVRRHGKGARTMTHMDLDGRRVAVEDRGSGDPVVLLHPGFVVDGMIPLLEDEGLARDRRLVVYHRRGYGRSESAAGPVTVAEQADDCLMLMDLLGIEAADLVGHSFGATIALEVALTAPERVRGLVLMEPLLVFALRPETAQFVADTAAVALPRYHAGDAAGAVEAWLNGAFGPGFREPLERALPGAFEQAVRDADAAFAIEVPSLPAWPRGPEALRRVTAPALSVVNEGATWPGFRETHDALLAWLPRAEGVVVPVGSHLLQIEEPAPVAAAIGGFLGRLATRERARSAA